MMNITTAEYTPRKGNAPSKKPNRRELTGYVPMERRIADLKAAGIRTAAVRDQRYYDEMKEGFDIDSVDIPPMPRHIPADLAEVSDLARFYKERQRIIEQKVRELNEKRRELAPDVTGVSPPREPAAETPVDPIGSKK